MSVFYNVLMEKSASKRTTEAFNRYIRTGRISPKAARRLKEMFGDDVLVEGSDAAKRADDTMRRYMRHGILENFTFDSQDRAMGRERVMRRDLLEQKLRENFARRGHQPDEYAGYTAPQFGIQLGHIGRKQGLKFRRVVPETDAERLMRISAADKAGRFGELSADDQHFVMTYSRRNLSPTRISALSPEAASRIMADYRARNVLGTTHARLRGEGISDISALTDHEALLQHFYDYGENANSVNTNVGRQLSVEKLRERLNLSKSAPGGADSDLLHQVENADPNHADIFQELNLGESAEGNPSERIHALADHMEATGGAEELTAQLRGAAEKLSPSTPAPIPQPKPQPSAQSSPQQQSNLKRNLLLASAGLTTAGGAGYLYHRNKKKRSEQR